MKRVIISNITSTTNKNYSKYTLDGRSVDGKAEFPINGILGELIAKNDEVKFVLLASNEGELDCKIDKFKMENSELTRTIGASVEYEIVRTDVTTSSESYRIMLMKIIDTLDRGAKLTIDMTAMPRLLMILLNNVMTYAENVLYMDIDHIFYGDIDKGVEGNIDIIDIAPIYYLNNIISNFDGDEKKSRDILERLMNLK